MASPIQWTWIWANSWRWWRTEEPGMLQSMGSQRVGHDWASKQQPLKYVWALKLTAHHIWDLETNSSHKMFGDRIEEVEEEWGRSSPPLIPFTTFCPQFPEWELGVLCPYPLDLVAPQSLMPEGHGIISWGYACLGLNSKSLNHEMWNLEPSYLASSIILISSFVNRQKNSIYS